MVRMQIVKALGWIGSTNAVPGLESALKDKYPFVRQQAATALKDITGKDYEYDKTGLPDLKRMQEAMILHRSSSQTNNSSDATENKTNTPAIGK